MPRRARGPSTASRVIIAGAGHTLDATPRALSGPPDVPDARSDSRGTPDESDALSAVYKAMPEQEFQAHVVAGLWQRGYIVFVVPDMRKTTAGLPDIVALGPVNGRGPVRLLMYECKRVGGRIRPEQRNAIKYLQMVETIDARIIRPPDWESILKELDSI